MIFPAIKVRIIPINTIAFLLLKQQSCQGAAKAYFSIIANG